MEYPFYLVRVVKDEETRLYCISRQELEDKYESGDKIFALDNSGRHIQADSIDTAVGIVLGRH